MYKIIVKSPKQLPVEKFILLWQSCYYVLRWDQKLFNMFLLLREKYHQMHTHIYIYEKVYTFAATKSFRSLSAWGMGGEEGQTTPRRVNTMIIIRMWLGGSPAVSVKDLWMRSRRLLRRRCFQQPELDGNWNATLMSIRTQEAICFLFLTNDTG